MAEPLISVLIVSWNTRARTLGCLEALTSGTRTPHHLIIVDNDSADGSATAVRERYPAATVIESGANRGFAGGVNLGLPYVRGDHVLLLNPDARPRPGAIDLLVGYLSSRRASDPAIAIAGPRLLNPDGSLQPSAHRFYSTGWSLVENALVASIWPWRYRRSPVLTLFDHAAPREVDWVSGACLLARREVFEAIGPFDEGFWMYGEEVDWQWRARKAGFKVHFVPDAEVVHEGGAAARLHPGGLRECERASRLRLVAKHHGPATLTLYRAKAGLARHFWSLWSTWTARSPENFAPPPGSGHSGLP